jgi:hypothetical protein
MVQFKAFASGTEVNGQTVLSCVAAMGAFKNTALHILAEHGIPNPKPGQWYSQQLWLNALKTIAGSIGENTLLQIGKRTLKNADWPPGTDSIEKALASIDVVYHMNHRKGEPGHYHFEKTRDGAGKMTCSNPYPCNFDTGVLEAVAERFGSRDLLVIVRHDDSQPCRKKGANSCTYLVSWREFWAI